MLALPRTGVDNELSQLLLIELLVTLGITAAMALVAFSVVGIGLRPLGAVELAAAAVAEGDLTRRVRRQDEKTEVGRLGRSFNDMVAKIEQAFAERTASEDRLRRFISDASHELRTPITAIRGYAELYRRGAVTEPEAVAGAMDRIESESERIGVLVEDLLLLARLDQGRPLERQPVDLVQVAREVAADAGVVHPNRPLSVESPESLVIEGDEGRLRQVFINLVQNALVHTPEEARVTVRVFLDGPNAVIEVEDKGPGISAEHLAHIFDRFYRADASRTRETGGAGLGLSIVTSIAEARGGRASVRSEPGQGSTFRVELPIETGDRVPEPAEAGFRS